MTRKIKAQKIYNRKMTDTTSDSNDMIIQSLMASTTTLLLAIQQSTDYETKNQLLYYVNDNIKQLIQRIDSTDSDVDIKQFKKLLKRYNAYMIAQ